MSPLFPPTPTASTPTASTLEDLRQLARHASSFEERRQLLLALGQHLGSPAPATDPNA